MGQITPFDLELLLGSQGFFVFDAQFLCFLGVVLDFDEQALVESQLVDFSESMGKLESEGTKYLSMKLLAMRMDPL